MGDRPVLALLAGISLGVASGLISGTGPGWLLLWAIPYVPNRSMEPYPIMASLESAVDRQVLRQAGTVYQFRHAVIQDHLNRP